MDTVLLVLICYKREYINEKLRCFLLCDGKSIILGWQLYYGKYLISPGY